jgi:hypothetical protein
VERLRARVAESPEPAMQPARPAPVTLSHKHSMSLIGRIRMARKLRRES